MKSAANESTIEREIERCRQEIAEIERQILAGHPDVAGLCLALHDWAQELRILQREGEQRVGQSTPPAASAPYAEFPVRAFGALGADRTQIED